MARSEETGQERLEARHLETAMKMARRTRRDEGRGDEAGPARLLHRHRVPAPASTREIYQEQLAKLRTEAPSMPWEKVAKVLRGGVRRRAARGAVRRDRARGVRRGLDRPGAPRHAARRAQGRGQDPVPGGRRGARGRSAQRGNDGRAWPGRSPPGSTRRRSPHELRERVLEELDYEYEAQNQRTFSRAYRDHPFVYVPDVLTRLSRRRVLVTEYVDGIGFEDVKRACRTSERSRFGEIVFRVQLRLDLPPPALQRRPPPRQLHPHGRRPGRLPRLRHDQAARPRADRARAAGDRRRRPRRPRGAARRRFTTSASSRTPRSSTPSG